MATGDYSFTYNTYLKENVWYAYNSVYDFNCGQINDPSFTKLYPSVNDNFYTDPVNESTTTVFDSSYNGYDGSVRSSNATYIPTTTWSSETGYIDTINFTMRDEID